MRKHNRILDPPQQTSTNLTTFLAVGPRFEARCWLNKETFYSV